MASLPLNEAGYLDMLVPLPLPSTPYSRIGDWPLVLLLIFVGVSALVARFRFGVDASDVPE